MAKKKEKITYIDDGRTLADMSGVKGGRLRDRNPSALRPSAKEVWKTYWSAVKMMFVPMLAVIGVIVVIYIIAYFLLVTFG